MGAGPPGSSFLPSPASLGSDPGKTSLPGSGPAALGLDDVSPELVEWGPSVLSTQEATELCLREGSCKTPEPQGDRDAGLEKGNKYLIVKSA